MSEQIVTRDIAKWIPKTYDETARSVRVVAVTENPIAIYDSPRGIQYSQVILVDGVQLPHHQQVPMLDSHNSRSVSNVLGSARNFKINGNALECDVYFSGTPLAVEAAQKVREGHLTDFSVGFIPVETVWIPEGETVTIRGRSFNGPVYVFTKWNLIELSITAVGRDRFAKVRSDNAKVPDGPLMNPPVPNSEETIVLSEWKPLVEVSEQETPKEEIPKESNAEKAQTAAEPDIPELSGIPVFSNPETPSEPPKLESSETSDSSPPKTPSEPPVECYQEASVVVHSEPPETPVPDNQETRNSLIFYILIILMLLAMAMLNSL